MMLRAESEFDVTQRHMMFMMMPMIRHEPYRAADVYTSDASRGERWRAIDDDEIRDEMMMMSDERRR